MVIREYIMKGIKQSEIAKESILQEISETHTQLKELEERAKELNIRLGGCNQTIADFKKLLTKI